MVIWHVDDLMHVYVAYGYGKLDRFAPKERPNSFRPVCCSTCNAGLRSSGSHDKHSEPGRSEMSTAHRSHRGACSSASIVVSPWRCSPALAAKKKSSKSAAAPAATPYQSALDGAYAKFKDLQEGKNADYIPALAKVDPNIFGIALVTTDGKVYTSGDSQLRGVDPVDLKVFTMAKVMEEQGPDAIANNMGVDATGQVFNSIVASSSTRAPR
jgi:hypothetical protein